MQLEVKKFLADALEAANSISGFAQNREFEDMARDKMFRSAIYWEFSIIGEALSQVRKLDTAVFDQISESWRIVGFRNQIIHGYQVIQDTVTWQIIQDKLPILQNELANLLR